METVRFNSTVLNVGSVQSVCRTADGVVSVKTDAFDPLMFRDPAEAAAVWDYFVNRSPDGMAGPKLADPAAAAATDARDQQWQRAFTDWLAGQEWNVSFGTPPTNPGGVAAALGNLSDTARDVGRSLLLEEQQAAAKAGKAGQNG